MWYELYFIALHPETVKGGVKWASGRELRRHRRPHAAWLPACEVPRAGGPPDGREVRAAGAAGEEQGVAARGCGLPFWRGVL